MFISFVMELERNLCVSDSVSDDIIQRAWSHLFGNNAVERIECRDSKKIIHLCPYYMENLEEDDEDELLEIYEHIEEYGKVMIWLNDPSVEWWIYGRAEEQDRENKENCFDVSFA